MTYYPHYKHSLDSGDCTARAIARSCNLCAALEGVLASRIADDRNGIAALGYVLAVAADPKWAGRALSSVRVRLLKAMPGWVADTSVGCVQYLVSPEGARVHLPDGILDAARIRQSNTCYGEAAEKRLVRYEETRKRIPAIAEAMRKYAEAAKHLHACCEDSTGLEYDPMTAAGIMAIMP